MQNRPRNQTSQDYSLYQEQTEEIQPDPHLPSHIEQSSEQDDFDYDDDEIQRDAANYWVAMAIHLALAFFLILFFCCIAGSILVVSQYGFVAFSALATLVFAFFGMFYFVTATIAEDSIMRPARRKLRRIHAIATAVAINELRNIQLDIYDHLMIENGSYESESTSEHVDSSVKTERVPRIKKRRIPRSALFGKIIAPLLKRKNGKKFKIGRKKQGTDSTEQVKKPNSGTFA